MKFNIGDFVRLIDERREGYITSIMGDDLVGVTDDDFEIPVSVSNITLVHERSGQKGGAGKETPSIALEDFIKTGIYLAIIPDIKINSVVQFYLVNQTSWQLAATLTTEITNKLKGGFIEVIAPVSYQKVYTAALTELDKWPEFSFQFLFYSIGDVPLLPPLLIKKKFRAKDFSGNKKEVPLLKQSGWLFQLDEEEIKIDTEKLKESFFKSSEEKRQIENPGKSIDLHIEKLRDDYEFLKSQEIFDIQLSHFRKTLDAAIVHKLPSIIFIHGSGNGTLRHEIHKQVSKHPQVKTFMDANKEKFGYGATEVIFK